MHSFASDGSDGSNPQTPMLEASDGNFYGVVPANGYNGTPDSGGGVIFKLTPAGVYTVLHYFPENSTTQGSRPFSPLVEGPNQTLYGLTSQRGQYGGGEAFKITMDGVYTTLHSFPSSMPGGWLTKGSDGFFYGTSLFAYGSISQPYYGTIFRMTADGVVTTLHTFNGTDGSNPLSGVVEGADGRFYGVAIEGGQHASGVVYKLSLPASVPTGLTASAVNGEVTLRWNASRPADTYNVYQSTVSGNALSAAAVKTGISGTSTVISGLQSGKRYYFVVAGVNEAGAGFPSEEVRATILVGDSDGGGGAFAPFWLCILLAFFVAVRRRWVAIGS